MLWPCKKLFIFRKLASFVSVSQTFVLTAAPVRVQPAPKRTSDTSDDLPGWARRGIDAPTLEVMDNEMEIMPDMTLGDDKNLPAWALKGLQK